MYLACKGLKTQITLKTMVKSKDDFILDYVKFCMLADIPLEKTEMRPFLRKHCAQAGALP